ncbi:unnamed protein product, partial [Polarella glacialis]
AKLSRESMSGKVGAQKSVERKHSGNDFEPPAAPSRSNLHRNSRGPEGRKAEIHSGRATPELDANASQTADGAKAQDEEIDVFAFAADTASAYGGVDEELNQVEVR